MSRFENPDQYSNIQHIPHLCCLKVTACSLQKAASQVPVRMRSTTQISHTGLSLDGILSWKAMCMTALNLYNQVKNECWFDPSEGAEDSDEMKHLPLSGHICFKKGE